MAPIRRRCLFGTRSLGLALAFATMLSLAAAAQGSPIQVIDSFSIPSGFQNIIVQPPITAAGLSTASAVDTFSNGGVSETRTFTINNANAGTGFRTGDVAAIGTDTPTSAMLTSSGQSSNQLLLNYAAAGSGFNLGSPSSLFEISFMGVSTQGGPTNITVTLTDNASNTATFSAPLSATSPPSQLTIPLSSFTGIGSLNLGSVTGVGVNVNDPSKTGGQTGVNVTITGIQVDPVVPEPATLAIWGCMGAIGALYARRRLQKKPVA